MKNDSDKKIVTIIQARMGSSRFPGKMMENLNDHPLMEWVVRRSQRAEFVDETVLATTTHRRDDVLADVAQKLGCPVFRGSESDVLGRYSAAAKKHKADIVVRVCADRPLVDPKLIDMAIREYRDDESDLVFDHISEGNQYWPRGFGVEVFSAKVLFWMDQNLESEYHREHVTPYLWENRGDFSIRPANCPENISPGFPDLKLDVDEVKDLDRIRTLLSDMNLYSATEEIIAKWKRLES